MAKWDLSGPVVAAASSGSPAACPGHAGSISGAELELSGPVSVVNMQDAVVTAPCLKCTAHSEQGAQETLGFLLQLAAPFGLSLR